MKASLFLVVLLFGLFGTGCSNDKQKKKSEISLKDSCYEQYSIKTGNTQPLRQIYIIIDQTTVFNDAIKENLFEKIKPFFIPGSKITLVKFSTFTDKYYTSIAKETLLDTPLTQELEDDTPILKVKKFKKCIEAQSGDMVSVIPRFIEEIMDDSNATLGQSEILKMLKDVSDSKIQHSKANEKIIFLVSDMLENSSVISFYDNNNIKAISSSVALSKIKSADLLSDFSGAKVYVIGAGMVTNGHKNRSTASIKSLKEFWELYFKASNASLVGFGTPELMEDIEIQE